MLGIDNTSLREYSGRADYHANLIKQTNAKTFASNVKAAFSMPIFATVTA